MFFFGLVVSCVCLWFAPWWSLSVGALVTGLRFPLTNKSCLQYSLAAACASAALAFVRDGQSYGQIAPRMAGLFGLPWPSLIFVTMAALGFFTMLFGVQSGRFLRALTVRVPRHPLCDPDPAERGPELGPKPVE